VPNVKRVSTFLVAMALIAGIIGCEPTPQYNLTVASTEGGSVTTPGEGIFTSDEGTVVNLVAETEKCYRFVNWTGDVGTIADFENAITTITMNDDYSIIANFEGEVVTFPDINLEAAVREAIDIAEDPIYLSDLDGLTLLVALGRGITNLSGLECCTNLTHLNLTNNDITDISPLTDLVSLTILYLGSNQISDISPLANITNLTILSLNGNQIADIGPLVDNEGLSDGDVVNLAGNPLSTDSTSIYIPELQSRGVTVTY